MLKTAQRFGFLKVSLRIENTDDTGADVTVGIGKGSWGYVEDGRRMEGREEKRRGSVGGEEAKRRDEAWHKHANSVLTLLFTIAFTARHASDRLELEELR